jgi:hypothetical protein
MSEIPRTDQEDELGPIDYLVVEFPDGRVAPGGFATLLDLSERGVIDVLDVEFVAKTGDGSVARVPVAGLHAADGFDPGIWDGASSGLFGDDDLAELGARLSTGSVAVLVVYENRWVLELTDAWRAQGARLIADGGLAADDVVAALDATEPR